MPEPRRSAHRSHTWTRISRDHCRVTHFPTTGHQRNSANTYLRDVPSRHLQHQWLPLKLETMPLPLHFCLHCLKPLHAHAAKLPHKKSPAVAIGCVGYAWWPQGRTREEHATKETGSGRRPRHAHRWHGDSLLSSFLMLSRKHVFYLSHP